MKRMAWLAVLALLPTPLSAQAVKLNASVRLRTETWDWFGTDAGGHYSFSAALMRASASQQRKNMSWTLEAAMPILAGLPSDAIAPAPRGQLGLGSAYWSANDSASFAAGVFLKQAFVRFGAKPGAVGHALKAGRFEFIDGLETVPRNPALAALRRYRIAHRLIGNFAWSHVQRSFDGAAYSYDGRAVNITAAVMRPTEGVFSTNGWSDLPINVVYAAVGNRGAEKSRLDARAFAIYYDDRRSGPVPLKADNRSASVRGADALPVTITTLGGHYLAIVPIAAGSLDLLAWGALQTGSWGLLDHSANAFALEAGFHPALKSRPVLRAGFARSSGDANATDQKHTTFFQVLPTPRGYARFPFFNAMNLADAFVSLGVAPTPKLSLRADAHRLRLVQSSDLWYGGGGAFDDRGFGYSGRPAGGQRALASLIDGSAQLQISKTLSTNVYAGFANGGPVIDAMYSAGATAHFTYIELEWRY